MARMFFGQSHLKLNEDLTIIMPEKFYVELEGSTELVALALDGCVRIWDRNDVEDSDLERIASMYSEL